MDATGRRRWLRTRIPADLGCLLLAVAAANGVVFVPGVRETPVRMLVGLPFLLFVPGYAFVAALFPEEGGAEHVTAGRGRAVLDDGERTHEGGPGIDGIERVALSFGTSIVLVPAIALGLTATPWGLRAWTVVAGVSLFTLAGVAVAVHRRRQLPPPMRFAVPYREWLERLQAERSTDPAERALSIVLVVSLLLAVGSVGYVVAVPTQPDPYTELSVLTENEEGELVASDYPTTLTAGESASVTLVVGNQEREPVTYSVVVELQQVSEEGGTVTVEDAERLDQFSVQLPHNSSEQVKTTFSPTMTGEDLRLVFLLYKVAPPPAPTTENAYRTVHLRLDVSPAS